MGLSPGHTVALPAVPSLVQKISIGKRLRGSVTVAGVSRIIASGWDMRSIRQLAPDGSDAIFTSSWTPNVEAQPPKPKLSARTIRPESDADA
ncbi:MAG: hypothetical protein WDO24_16365 [Pseudomonadota bacterium]